MKHSSSSSGSSTISRKHIELALQKLKASQTRASTTKNYHAIWRIFNNFLIRLVDKNKSRLTWEQKVVLFGTYMVEQGAQSQTIKSYFSAIKHILKTDGYPWDESSAMLSIITRSCRIVNDRLKIRLPIRVRLLEQLLFEMDRKYGNQLYLNILYKAMFSIAYYGMMRVGEIAMGSHAAKAKDVHVAHNKDKILIMLYTSKTPGVESKPQEIKVEGIQNTTQRFFCPFKLMRRYMAYRGEYLQDTEQFFVFSDRSLVDRAHVCTVLRDLLTRLTLDALLYDTHSFHW